MKWIGYLVLAVVGGFVLLLLLGAFVSSDNADGTWSDSNAASFCDEAVKQMAKNPSSVEIPYVRGQRNGDEITYAWRMGDGLRMQNGFGAMIDAEMYCVVDVRQKKLVWIASTPRT